jgi:hypothetical protein
LWASAVLEGQSVEKVFRPPASRAFARKTLWTDATASGARKVA